MHDAYEAVLLVEKLPRQIEALACYSDNLLVGTKEGQLLIYSVRRTDVGRFETNIERSNRLFSKKPITQLHVIPEYHILVSLSDGVVSVHDLTVFALITSIEKARGASLFALDLQRQMTENGDVQFSLRICVVVKRRLQLFYWKNRDFHELLPDLLIPDVTRAIAWCDDSLCIGFKREYFLIKIESGLLKEIFSTGHQMEPLIVKLSENRLALTRDETTVFIDSDGNPTQKVGLSWTSTPTAMVYNKPYIIAILANSLEVRTMEPRLLIQNTEVIKPKLICCGGSQGDQVYVASQSSLWRLSATPIATQIKQLIAKREFELALHLAEMMDESATEKERQVLEIRNLHSFDLFCQHRFSDAMKTFIDLGTDPSHVVGLFPNLLPGDYRSQLEYPDRIPDLDGTELERGLKCLIDYLTQKRNEVLKETTKEVATTPIVEGAPVMRSRKQMSQMIDTTLLKCYIQMNDALLAPLLRLKDNNCHLEETERILKQHQKFSELVILYERNALHTKALDLLLRQSQKLNSPLSGHEPTLEYLQRLGPNHMDLIFDYAVWVIRACPQDGLQIFTEDLEEVRSLPRFEILRYLERTEESLAIPYLEHVINEWMDDMPELHNILGIKYVQQVARLLTDASQQQQQQQQPSENGDRENGGDRSSVSSLEMRQVRHNLVDFLDRSPYYEAERLLQHFPSDNLFEERAVLLGKLGQHEKALAVYVYVLHDYEAAENYCLQKYEAATDGNDDTSTAQVVFLYLLKLYLTEPDYDWIGVSAPLTSSTTLYVFPDLSAALHLLTHRSSYFDVVKALNLLPSSVCISDVLKFVEDSLLNSTARKWNSHIMKSLLSSQHLQVLSGHLASRHNKCIITDQSTCRVCRKRIGNSAFARYPNEVIVHYYCCKDVFTCPDDG